MDRTEVRMLAGILAAGRARARRNVDGSIGVVRRHRRGLKPRGRPQAAPCPDTAAMIFNGVISAGPIKTCCAPNLVLIRMSRGRAPSPPRTDFFGQHAAYGGTACRLWRHGMPKHPQRPAAARVVLYGAAAAARGEDPRMSAARRRAAVRARSGAGPSGLYRDGIPPGRGSGGRSGSKPSGFRMFLQTL